MTAISGNLLIGTSRIRGGDPRQAGHGISSRKYFPHTRGDLNLLKRLKFIVNICITHLININKQLFYYKDTFK